MKYRFTILYAGSKPHVAIFSSWLSWSSLLSFSKFLIKSIQLFISKSLQHNLQPSIYSIISTIITGAQGPIASQQLHIARIATLMAVIYHPLSIGYRTVHQSFVLQHALLVKSCVYRHPFHGHLLLGKCCIYSHSFYQEAVLLKSSIICYPCLWHDLLVNLAWLVTMPSSIIQCHANRSLPVEVMPVDCC